MKKRVLIIGAGPAGLASAYELSKYEEYEIKILEKDDRVGGYAKSIKWDKDILDIGPHAFHSKGGEIEKLVKGLFHNEENELVSGSKKVSVYLEDKFFKYPLQVKEALLKFNIFTSFRIILEFILTSLFHGIVSIPITNFEEWGRKRFGSKLYQLSFGDYTEKVWKIKPSKISIRFASEKIQGFSFINLIKKLFKIGGQVTEPYYQEWIYSKKGSGDIFNRFRDKINEYKDFEIKYNVCIDEIDSKQKKVKLSNREVFEYDILINTAPLPVFMNMLSKNLPYEVKYHANKLKYNSLTLVYLKLNLKKLSDNTWFYLLDKRFKVNRITEQKNLTKHTVNGDYTILTYEYTHKYNDEYSKLSDKDAYEMALNDSKMVNILSDKVDKIIDYKVDRYNYAYEIYDINFDAHVDVAISYLNDELEDVYTTGRRGMFLQGDMYNAIDISMESAKLIHDNATNDEMMRYYKKHMKFLD